MQEDRNTPSTSIKTFKIYAQEWMQTYKKPKVGDVWYTSMESILSNHIYPAIGNMLLSDIKATDIASIYSTSDKLSLSMNKKIKIIIKSVLDSAVEDGLIVRNVADTKRLIIPGGKKERLPLTDAELQNIRLNIDKLSDEDSLLIALLYYTGMRRGELLALKWDDIDMDSLIIHVSHSITFNGNKALLKPPKSKAGIRQIPICNELKEKLEKYKGNDTNVIGTYVIGNDDLYTTTKYKRTWERIIKTLDIPDATAHRFRHSFVTRMKNILDAKTLQSITGHSDISTTMNVYAHTTDEDIQKARIKMNESQKLN